MPLNPDHVLSAQAVEALDALRLDTSEPEIVSDADLLGVILQQHPKEDSERISRLLLRSPQSRRRMVELWGESRQLFSLPLERWSDAPSAFTDLVAMALIVPNGIPNRLSEARTLLASIGRHIRILLSAPRFAPMRGGEASRLSIGLDSEGTLEATATPMGAERAAEGEIASLSIADPLGGFVPIATSVLSRGTVRFTVEGFGALTGLPEGPLPSSLFDVRWGDAGKKIRPGPSFLWVEGPDGDVVSLEFSAPPSVSRGILTLDLRIPSGFLAAYPSGRLILSLPTGTQEVTLGSWLTSELSEATHLRIFTTGVPDGALPFGSILRARMIVVEGS